MIRPADTSPLARGNALRSVNLAFALGLFYMAAAIPVFLFAFHDPIVLAEHVFTVVVVLCLLTYVNATKQPAVGRWGMLALTVVTALTLVLNGAAYNAGIYLMLPTYVFIFYLAGGQVGSRIVRFMFYALLVAYVLYLGGVVTLPYSKPNFGIFLFAYALAYAFFAMYSHQKDTSDARLQISLRKNEELIGQLRREKAGIEDTVAERTRQLTEAQAKLMASIGGLPFGFALIGSNHEIAFANGLLGELLGHLPGEHNELTFRHISGHLKAARLDELIAQTETSRRPVERNLEQESQFFRLRLTPIIATGNTVLGSVLVLEDTTEEKLLERSRDEFFSIASHELRTPLTAIRGNLSLIQQYYPKILKDHELAQMLTDSHDASVRLIQIVNDFLDASRLEQRRLVFSFEPLDVIDLLNQIHREYEVTRSRRRTDIQLIKPEHPLPQVITDRDRARQVLINLLSNALKYTPLGGHIIIKPQHVGDMVKIQVIDNGQGVPAESQPLLFRKFQQAANNVLTRDNTSSTGLGLYIARLMAQDMHGRLYLEASELGKGSTFTLELPVAKTASKAGPKK